MPAYNEGSNSNTKQKIWGAVVPYGFTASGIATHEDIDGIGGHHCVATNTEMNAIHADKRRWGMTCFVQSTEIEYMLEKDLTTWTGNQSTT